MSYASRLIFAAILTFSVATAGSQPYPSKPIRVVVPFPPASGLDIATRLISAKAGESLGRQLVIDNRAGGSGIAGTEIVARSTADGYTLLMATGGILTVLPVIGRNLSYSTRRDFAPITRVAATPNILVVPLSLPAKSTSELIALARAKPGALNYASTGIGTGSHLAAELFKMHGRIDIVHVPYQGSGQALADLMGGRVEMFFNNLLTAMPQVRAGKLRALAVTSPTRLPIAPEVPTVAESGLPGFETETWYGLLAPIGTPRAIISRLHAAVVRALRLPEIQERFAAEGARPIGSSPEQFSAYVASETARWQKVLTAAGVRGETK